MPDSVKVADLSHTAEVSFSEQIGRGTMTRRDFKIPSLLIPEGIGKVRLAGGSGRVDAVVALKTILTSQDLAGGDAYVRDQWRALLAPYDKDLLTRLLAETGDGSVTLTKLGDPADLVVAQGIGEAIPAKSDIIKTLRRAHEKLSHLRPPREETFLLVVLWQDEVGDVGYDFVASSLSGLKNQLRKAKQNNRLVRASSTPFGSPITAPGWLPLIGGKQVWGKGELMDEPFIPESDEWVITYTEQLKQIIEADIKPALHSLWRAVFAEDPVASQLRDQGYLLTETDRTNFGGVELAELIERRGRQRGNFTVAVPPEMLGELAEDSLEPL